MSEPIESKTVIPTPGDPDAVVPVGFQIPEPPQPEPEPEPDPVDPDGDPPTDPPADPPPDGDDPPADPDPDADPDADPATPQVWDIDGETWEEEDLVELAQYAGVMSTLREEALEKKAAGDRLIADASDNPAEFLYRVMYGKHKNEKLAYDAVVEIATQVINHNIAKAQKSPEQLANDQMLAENARLKAELEAAKTNTAAQAETTQLAKDTADAVATITPVATEMGLTDSPKDIGDVAEIMLKAQQGGIPISVKRAVQKVLKQREALRGASLEDVDIETLPKALLDRIRQADIERLKKDKSAPAETPTGESGVDSPGAFKRSMAF